MHENIRKSSFLMLKNKLVLLNGSNRKYAIISCCFLAGETALHLACIRNDAEKVEEILKQGWFGC